MKLFEDYRNCLIGFANSCVCEDTIDHQMTFNRLEENYKIIVDEDMKNSAIFPEKTINIGFNKQQKVSKTNDNNNESVDENKETEETVVSNEVNASDNANDSQNSNSIIN